MKRLIHKNKVLLTVIGALFLYHLSVKDFSDPFQRPIVGDAQAYYAYLPAVFIYGDLSYDFVDEINQKHYPEPYRKVFLTDVGNEKVNKTFPGVALLYLPFFLIAHGLALLFGLDADGYSMIYQVLFDIGLWTYLTFALLLLNGVLERLGFSLKIAQASILTLLLGTNLFFYAVFDQSVTHVYSFFLVNLLVFILLKWQYVKTDNLIIAAVSLLALIGIVRPTNILVLLLLVVLFPKFSFWKSFLSHAFKPKVLFPLLIISGVILFIPFLLWKLQSGQWFIYSYGEEGFNFFDPYFFSFLFSYLKGWFVYTPMALVILIFGLYFLYQKKKKQAVFAFLFYGISVYLFSSWWCWYYGAGMGQRVMIDHFVLLAYLLALILQKIQLHQKSLSRIVAIAIICLFSAFNILQAHQIRYGVLPGGAPTEAQYWDTFLSLNKKSRVYPYDHWQLVTDDAINLEPESPFILKGTTRSIEGEYTMEVSPYENYSASLQIPYDNWRFQSRIIFSFEARSRTEITETRAVLNLNAETITYRIAPYVSRGNWVRIEFLVEPQEPILAQPVLFFWNGGTEEKVEFKNFSVKHYFSEDYL